MDTEDTELKEATDFFKPFPDPDLVFKEEIEKHSKYLIHTATQQRFQPGLLMSLISVNMGHPEEIWLNRSANRRETWPATCREGWAEM